MASFTAPKDSARDATESTFPVWCDAVVVIRTGNDYDPNAGQQANPFGSADAAAAAFGAQARAAQASAAFAGGGFAMGGGSAGGGWKRGELARALFFKARQPVPYVRKFLSEENVVEVFGRFVKSGFYDVYDFDANHEVMRHFETTNGGGGGFRRVQSNNSRSMIPVRRGESFDWAYSHENQSRKPRSNVSILEVTLENWNATVDFHMSHGCTKFVTTLHKQEERDYGVKKIEVEITYIQRPTPTPAPAAEPSVEEESSSLAVKLRKL
jgi:hypothetical protein